MKNAKICLTPHTTRDPAHGGSHDYLMDEFVTAVLQGRRPLVDISMALNLTVAGIVAHQSALKEGELLKIPQFSPIACRLPGNDGGASAPL